MSKDSSPFIIARPFSSGLLSLLCRPLFLLTSSVSSHLYAHPLHLSTLSFSLLLQLIILECLLINRINVFSDALCHALVPLSCFTVFCIVEDGSFFGLDCGQTESGSCINLKKKKRKRNKKIPAVAKTQYPVLLFLIHHPVHQRHSSNHLKRHRSDIELSDVSLAEPD